MDPSGSDSVMLGYEQDVDSQRHTSLSPPLHRSPSHEESGIATHKSGHRAAVDVPVDLSVLKGLEVGEDGKIFNVHGEQVGQLDEGDLVDIAGKTIGDDGEILDEDGDIIGHASALPGQAQDAADKAKVCLPEISALEGLDVGDGGNIMDSPRSIDQTLVPTEHLQAQTYAHMRSSKPPTKMHKTFPYVCLHPGCTRRFARSFDLDRHYRITHLPETAKRLDCPKAASESWCQRIGARGFTRLDHLNEHLRKVHLMDLPTSSRGSRHREARKDEVALDLKGQESFKDEVVALPTNQVDAVVDHPRSGSAPQFDEDHESKARPQSEWTTWEVSPQNKDLQLESNVHKHHYEKRSNISPQEKKLMTSTSPTSGSSDTHQCSLPGTSDNVGDLNVDIDDRSHLEADNQEQTSTLTGSSLDTRPEGPITPAVAHPLGPLYRFARDCRGDSPNLPADELGRSSTKESISSSHLLEPPPLPRKINRAPQGGRYNFGAAIVSDYTAIDRPLTRRRVSIVQVLQHVPRSGGEKSYMEEHPLGLVTLALYERLAPRALSIQTSKQYLTQLKTLISRSISGFVNTISPEATPAAGKTRIWWTCACGSRLYDDFVELRPGAAHELRTSLHSLNRQRLTGQQPISSSRTYVGDATTTDPNRSSGSPSAGLPGLDVRSVAPSYDPRPTNARPTSTAIACGPESKWLLVCAQAWHRPTSLLHLNVCSTTSDQQLFTELRQLYVSLKKAWWHRLSLKVVQSIRYVQFELHPRDLVDVRKVPDMPPESRKDEYVYQACDLIPPIGENLMTHLFHHPHEANEKAITFQRSPKKRKQRLAVCPQMGTNLGWGIHLVEGWAMAKIWLLACIVFVLSGLTFAIAWSVLKHDLQGAFGVAAFFTTLAGLGIGTVQA
ncbi:MAG: hypothetical protein Q9210_006262, partial [Variospora velana]